MIISNDQQMEVFFKRVPSILQCVFKNIVNSWIVLIIDWK